MSCEICDKLGDRLRADFLEGEKLPPEASRLTVLTNRGWTFELRQCPLCNTYYRHIYEWDNDIFNRYEVAELVRISPEEGEAMLRAEQEAIEEEEREIKKFRRKVHRAFRAKLATLSEREEEIVEHLIRKRISGEYLTRLEERFGLKPEELENILSVLEGKKILSRKVNWPLRPGKHGFQEEMRDVNPRPHTTIAIDWRRLLRRKRHDRA